MLPYRRATRSQVLRAMERNGIDPQDIAWCIGTDGALALAPKRALGEEPTFDKVKGLLRWARRRRIRIRPLESG